jgi:hypothetical protein
MNTFHFQPSRHHPHQTGLQPDRLTEAAWIRLHGHRQTDRLDEASDFYTEKKALDMMAGAAYRKETPHNNTLSVIPVMLSTALQE